MCTEKLIDIDTVDKDTVAVTNKLTWSTQGMQAKMAITCRMQK